MKILHEDCEVGVATDKTLPYTAYLVEYVKEKEGEEVRAAYDLVISGKAVDIFDHYYDKYKKNFKKFTQTEGRANPNTWNIKPTPPKKKKRK